MKYKKYTHNEFQEVCKEKFTLLGQYVDSQTKIKTQCKDCGAVFNGIPKKLKVLRGCPTCGKKEAAETVKHEISTSKYRAKLAKKRPDVELLSEYTGVFNKITVLCRTCGYQWSTTPARLNQNGCYKCGHRAKAEKCKYSQEEFEQKIKALFGDKIKICSEYLGGDSSIEFICTKCDKVKRKKAALLLRGRGCLECRRYKSNAEDLIECKLIELGIRYETQYTMQGLVSGKNKPLLLDFALLNDKLEPIAIIEYNGEQHYRPIEYFGGQKRYEQQIASDTTKAEFLQNKNIPLIILNNRNIKGFNWESLRNYGR